jgi:hypothetical protein
MRKFYFNQVNLLAALFLAGWNIVSINSFAQLQVKDFAIFSGTSTQIGSSTTINGGSVGSKTLVQTTGTATFNANIYSGGKVTLANSNTVSGKIAAANLASLTGTILSVGTSASLRDNIDVKGNIVIGISGSVVSDTVTHPQGTTYSGPNIGARNKTGTPTLPALPQLPDTTIFPAAGSTDKTSGPISPGAYGNLTIGGNTTVTLSGPGTYIFKSITSDGPNSQIIFDFNNTTAGDILIYVYGNVVLKKMTTSMMNGGSASRIYAETHGRASVAWDMSNGSNGSSNTAIWLGTVYAPFGAIAMGSPNGPASLVTGALLSGAQVTIQGTSIVNYSPFSNLQQVIIPFSPGIGKVSTIIGAELTSIAGGTITDEAKKIMVISGGYVLIDVIAKVGSEAAVLSYLISEGMTGIISGVNPLTTTGNFPIANLFHLNTRGDIINFCMPVFVPSSNSGLIKNAGDTAIGSQLVRNGYGLQGLGVKVGILSDSYNALVTPTNDPVDLDITTGELPGVGNPINSTPVILLDPLPQYPGSDEGRAMLQVVHDIAPKAALYFRTGFRGPNDLAIGIKHLQEAGCNVIVDDITYVNESFFQDGPVAKMVDSVKKLGVTYLTSAGNFANNSQSQNFKAVSAPAGFPDSARAHDFSGTGDIYQHIKLKPGSYTIALQWEDSSYSSGLTHTGTKNDFDIYLTDMSGNIICGYNRDNTLNGGGDPFEFLAYTVSSTVTEADANILIIRANKGTTAPRFKYIIFRGDAVITEWQAGTSTIVGHANAAGAITVGAINYFRTPAFTAPVCSPNPKTKTNSLIASYSSTGGTLISGETNPRPKPDITAPDGVNTSVNMGADHCGDIDAHSNFFGTSAAAPNAAATAALLIEGRRRFLSETPDKPDTIKALLQRTALHIAGASPTDEGAGLIQADLAMRSFAAPIPFIILPIEYSATNNPGTFKLTVHGDYFTDESQIKLRGVAVPTTTFVSTTELTANIPAESGNPTVQVYTPPLANGDGGTSNIVRLFDIPKKTITIRADDKTKIYGDTIPYSSFTSSIMVNNVPLAQSGLTLKNIGLETGSGQSLISYYSNATPLSNVPQVASQYFIKPVRTFNLNNATDAGLLELYTYDTIPGTLNITKLPVTIVPNDQTITYGQDIAPITFDYQIAPAIVAANPEVVNIIRLSHQEFLAADVIGVLNRLPVAISNTGLRVAISNGLRIAISNGLRVAISNQNGQDIEIPIYNAQSVTGFDIGVATVAPYTLTPQELANLSFYTSEKSLLNTRQLTANNKIIDIAQQSILEYNTDPSLTTMVNTIDPSKPKGILGAEPLSNGSLPIAISNGGLRVAISNTLPIAISNGGLRVAISNGQDIPIGNGGLRVAISNSFTDQAHRIAVIIDQTDVDDQTGIVLRALNTVTGLSPVPNGGSQFIIPGSVLNDNYAITYGLGHLFINPATVTIKAVDTARIYGEPNPVFRATYSGFKYGETLETSDITGTPSLTTVAVQASPVNTYDINASAGSLSSANYTFSFQKGKLTIGNNPCSLLTHKAFTNFGSTTNTKTSLWLNIETKVSGQLSKAGDYLLFNFGTVTFNNITSNPAIRDWPIPVGKIVAVKAADYQVLPFTRYEGGMWVTRVPEGFSSTSDIFITGVIINSTTGGFTKKNGANSVVKGFFYINNSNKSFSDQWAYGIAAYQPQFDYGAIADSGQVTSINGTYRAGTPKTLQGIPISTLVNGGSGGGGNNYTGSSSSYDNFSACPVAGSSNVITSSRSAGNTMEVKTKENSLGEKASFTVTPNPAGNYADILFTPSVPGNIQLSLFMMNGVKVADIYNGYGETGKTFQKRINVSMLPAGIYLVWVENGGIRKLKKLIIAR